MPKFRFERQALLMLSLIQQLSPGLTDGKAMEMITDPDCYYIAKTRVHNHFFKSKSTILLPDGRNKTIRFCRIRNGRACYPDGIELFNLENHLVKEVGAQGIGSKIPVKVDQKIGVDNLKEYQNRLRGLSCEAGQCSSHDTSPICFDDGLESNDKTHPPAIKWKQLVNDMAADGNLSSLQPQSVFQQLRDICYYIRRTRYAGAGSKAYYPGASLVQWTRKASDTEFLEMCEIPVHNDCYPRDVIEETNLLEYLRYMQRDRSSLNRTAMRGSKMGPKITIRDGIYYFYRMDTIFKVLNWSCASGSYCNQNRVCVPDPAKLPKAPLQFYEYEADMATLEPIPINASCPRKFPLNYGPLILWILQHTSWILCKSH